MKTTIEPSFLEWQRENTELLRGKNLVAHRINQAFGRRIPLWKTRRLAISASPWLLPLLLLLLLTLALKTLPYYYSGFAEATYWLMAAATVLGFVLSLIAREVYRLSVARRWGARPHGLVLHLFGADCPVELDQPRRLPRLAVGASGLAFNLFLSMGFFALSVFSETNVWPRYTTGVLFHLAAANLTICAVQLLPILPLDGGQWLLGLLHGKEEPSQSVVAALYYLGLSVGLAGMVVGINEMVLARPVMGGWIALISLLLIAANHHEYAYQRLKLSLRGRTVRDLLHRAPVAIPGRVSLEEFEMDYVERFPYTVFPVLYGKDLAGFISRIALRLTPRPWREMTDVWSHTRPVTPLNSISADKPAVNALHLMRETGSPRLLVVRHNTLAGILTYADLLREK